MTSPGTDDKKDNKKTKKIDRLAAALRENLRRRKAPERQRKAKAGPEAQDNEAG